MKVDITANSHFYYKFKTITLKCILRFCRFSTMSSSQFNLFQSQKMYNTSNNSYKLQLLVLLNTENNKDATWDECATAWQHCSWRLNNLEYKETCQWPFFCQVDPALRSVFLEHIDDIRLFLIEFQVLNACLLRSSFISKYARKQKKQFN